jgi:hypothetical protein
MTRHLLLMTKPNLAKCENGSKTQTRRCNKQWLKIKKGHWVYFRSDYKTTYENASGPYLATEDARLEKAQDISPQDCIAEGIPDPGPQGSQADWIKAVIGAFCNLWNSINKKPGTTWADNPSVVRIAFERMN